MNRRELLTAFLGASAAALSGCGNSKTPSLPSGELIGGSDNLGHKLREAPPQKPEHFEDVDIAIVGAGVAGLSAAWRLARKKSDARIVLLELESNVGGTSRSGVSKVSAFPWGAHYLPVPQKHNRDLITLLDEMGLVEGADASGEPVIGEQFLCRDPQERIFHGGKWHEGLYLREGASADDLRQFDIFKQDIKQWCDWRDGKGRPAFSIPAALSSDDAAVKELDRITMTEYLSRKGLNSERLRWYVNYACRDDYATTLETTSAWAGLFYFASRKSDAEHDAQPLITWPEGNGRLVNHLYQAARARIVTDAAVAEIFHEPSDTAHVYLTAIRRSSDKPAGYKARKVLFAAPQFVARYAIRDYRAAPPPHLFEFQYGAWMVANLTLKDRPKESEASFEPCWDNVIYDSPSLGYVIATHQTEQDRGPTVLTYYYPFCDRDPKEGRKRLLSAGWSEWAEVALADLSVAHTDIRQLTERIDIMRWGHGMIQPRPGFVWSGAREKATAPFRGIHFAHSDLSGVALFEEAFYHGIRAADEVLATFT